MDLKDTLEPKSKEIVLYQLIDPSGKYIREPVAFYRRAWLQIENSAIDVHSNVVDSVIDFILDRVKSGYRVIEVTYIPKQ